MFRMIYLSLNYLIPSSQLPSPENNMVVRDVLRCIHRLNFFDFERKNHLIQAFRFCYLIIISLVLKLNIIQLDQIFISLD